MIQVVFLIAEFQHSIDWLCKPISGSVSQGHCFYNGAKNEQLEEKKIQVFKRFLKISSVSSIRKQHIRLYLHSQLESIQIKGSLFGTKSQIRNCLSGLSQTVSAWHRLPSEPPTGRLEERQETNWYVSIADYYSKHWQNAAKYQRRVSLS